MSSIVLYLVYEAKSRPDNEGVIYVSVLLDAGLGSHNRLKCYTVLCVPVD